MRKLRTCANQNCVNQAAPVPSYNSFSRSSTVRSASRMMLFRSFGWRILAAWNGRVTLHAVLDMQPHSIFDIRHGLFVRVPLAVTPLERGAGDEIAIFVNFQYHGKRQFLHGGSIFFSESK